MDVREREKNYKRGSPKQGRQLMNLHNNEAGRRVRSQSLGKRSTYSRLKLMSNFKEGRRSFAFVDELEMFREVVIQD